MQSFSVAFESSIVIKANSLDEAFDNAHAQLSSIETLVDPEIVSVTNETTGESDSCR